ncbi:MAG: transcription-repair coupling factor, partial [Bacteroidota bacterium]
MNPSKLINTFSQSASFEMLSELINNDTLHVIAKGMVGSSVALAVTSLFNQKGKQQHIVVLPEKEQAAYFYNDVENLLDEANSELNQKKVLFYPTSYKRPYEPETVDRAYQLSRTEVLKRTISGDKKTIIITYPEALAEKVITKKYLNSSLMKLKKGEEVSLDFISDLLFEFEFDHVEFVAEPGQFAIRGGIVDVFSFSNEHPYRIEFFGDEVESIRTFDPSTQLSIQQLNRITLLPNIQSRELVQDRVGFLDYIPASTIFWFDDMEFVLDRIDKEYEKAIEGFAKLEDTSNINTPQLLFNSKEYFEDKIPNFSTIEFSS